jgi:regulator of sirC expression with transglutaminase-like and TPR domain
MAVQKENKELNALISLLDEPNQDVFSAIRDKIYSYGSDAIALLEHAWENSFDPVIHERIEELIKSIQFNDILTSLKTWANEPHADLLKGYILVSRYQFPDLDQEKIIKQVGQLTQDVWLELNNELTSLEKVKVINHIFFDVHKFSGNRANISAPENVNLKTFLESKKGSPLSLGLLYIIVAQSLKIPVYGIDLPRHFIMGYADKLVDRPEYLNEKDIRFYINPFNKGAVFTRNEIDMFISQLKLIPTAVFFKPCSLNIMLKRLIGELITSYEMLGNENKIKDLKLLSDALSDSVEDVF